MLVLRRKAGEAIVLNGVITIYVLAVEGERVKLGISAPPEVVIVRSELLDTPGGAPTGPGGPMGGPVSAPMGGRPAGPPPPESSPDYGRGPRGPERPYRDNERPYREREPEAPMRPSGAPVPANPNQPSGFGSPARYTPRRRFDNYGDDVGAPVTGPQDPLRYR